MTIITLVATIETGPTGKRSIHCAEMSTITTVPTTELAARHRGDVNIHHCHVTRHQTMMTTTEVVQPHVATTALMGLSPMAIYHTGDGHPHPTHGARQSERQDTPRHRLPSPARRVQFNSSRSQREDNRDGLQGNEY